MHIRDFFNAGCMHDIPIGRGARFQAHGHHFAVFRETFGHFYVFADESIDYIGPIFRGIIENGHVSLPDGHTIDLHTGEYDHSGYYVPSFTSWVENGFILFSDESEN